jgi:hypothetical protein
VEFQIHIKSKQQTQLNPIEMSNSSTYSLNIYDIDDMYTLKKKLASELNIDIEDIHFCSEPVNINNKYEITNGFSRQVFYYNTLTDLKDELYDYFCGGVSTPPDVFYSSPFNEVIEENFEQQIEEILDYGGYYRVLQ